MKYPEFFPLGLVFLGLAGFVLYHWLKLQRRIREMVITPTSNIGALVQGAPCAGRMVEIKGNLVPVEPVLKAPYTGRECVFFHSVKKDKIRDVHRSGGKTRSVIRYQVLEEFRSDMAFFVEDRTGRIAVDPQGLEIEAQKVLNTSKPYDGASGQFGIFMPPPGDYYLATLTEEHILPPKRRVYVIGELYRDAQGAFIGAPLDKGHTAFLSIRTEETILEEDRRQLRMYTFAFLLVTMIGFYFLIISH